MVNGHTTKVIVGVFCTLMVGWMGWMSLKIIDIDKRVAVIEGNRFDSGDALDLRRHLDAQLGIIMRELGTKVDDDEVPPQWFLEEFRNLEKKVERHVENGRNR